MISKLAAITFWAYSIPKCSNRKIFLNNKYCLEHCGVHGWLGRRACCNYMLNNHCRENIFVLSKRYCRILFFSRNGTSPKKSGVTQCFTVGGSAFSESQV